MSFCIYNNNNTKMNLSKEDFNFIDNEMTKICMINGCWTLDRTGLWEWLKDYEVDEERGFMFSSSTELTTIELIMESKSAPERVSHSGASFAFTMRNLHYIAKNGFDAYKNMVLGKNKNDS